MVSLLSFLMFSGVFSKHWREGRPNGSGSSLAGLPACTMAHARQTLPVGSTEMKDGLAPSAEYAYRRKIRTFLERIWVEKTTIAVVFFYMLLVLLDLVLDDVRTWSAAFLYVDLVFLSFLSLIHI